MVVNSPQEHNNCWHRLSYGYFRLPATHKVAVLFSHKVAGPLHRGQQKEPLIGCHCYWPRHDHAVGSPGRGYGKLPWRVWSPLDLRDLVGSQHLRAALVDRSCWPTLLPGNSSGAENHLITFRPMLTLPLKMVGRGLGWIARDGQACFKHPSGGGRPLVLRQWRRGKGDPSS